MRVLIAFLLMTSLSFAGEHAELIKELGNENQANREIAQLKLSMIMDQDLIKELKEGLQSDDQEIRQRCIFLIERWYNSVVSHDRYYPLPSIYNMPNDMRFPDGPKINDVAEKYFEKAKVQHNEKCEPNEKYLTIITQSDYLTEKRLEIIATRIWVMDRLDAGMKPEDIVKLLDLFVMENYATGTDGEDGYISSILEKEVDALRDWIKGQLKKLGVK